MHGSTRNIYVSSYIYLATYRVIGDQGGGVEDAVAAGEGLDKAFWIQQIGAEEDEAIGGAVKGPQVVVLWID